MTIDLNRFAVRWNNTPVDLTLTEFWMVHTLAQHPGHVKNREQLMELGGEFGAAMEAKNWDEAEAKMKAMMKLMTPETP